MSNRRATSRLTLLSAAVALTVLLTGCTSSALASGAAAASASITGGPAAAGASASDALTQLATLTVRGKGPKTGYDRTAMFGSAWMDVDRNGCDTRNDILARDLTGDRMDGSCTVLAGTLNDTYTGRTINFVRGNKTSMAVQIDHRVALLDAWQSGAPKLSQERREALANDPINLVSVDGPTNSSKGARDAAAWLPPQKSYRCIYVVAQITVKSKYALSVTGSERDAMKRVLGSCGTATAPAAPASAPAVPAPVVPAPAPPTAPTPADTIHPGSWCPTSGATGVAASGTTYTCGLKGPDAAGKFHWNS